MIYFDNAATSYHKPQEVKDAVMNALNGFGNAARGAHEASLTASRIIHDAREQAAIFFHAQNPSQVVFTSGITESLNIAIKGLLSPGDHCITTAAEHNSVLRPLYEMKAADVSLTILPLDEKGNISRTALEDAIRPETKFIVCTAASNVTGNVFDIQKIADIAHRHNTLLVVDTAQAAGIFTLDMEKDGIDVLCFTGHKGLHGVQGTGGLVIRDGINIRPLKTGGSGVHSFSKTHPAELPVRLEAGTLNGSGIAALGAAFKLLNQQGLDNKALSLARTFYDGVKDIPGIRFYGDYEAKNRAPIVSLNLGDTDASLVADYLMQRFDICMRAGAHCAPLVHETFGTVEQGMVRFSFDSFNTEEEVETAIRALHLIAEENSI